MFEKSKNFSNEEIIRGIQEQDLEILRHIYQEYFPLVEKMIKKYHGRPEEAWDLFQDSLNVLVDLIERKNGQLLIEHTFKSFFLGMCKNVWFKKLRLNQKYLEARNQFAYESMIGKDFDEEFFENSLFRIYLRNLNKMKPDCIKMIKMLTEELPGKEMAELMNLQSSQALYNKKRTCLKKLINLINDDPEYKNLTEHGKPKKN